MINFLRSGTSTKQFLIINYYLVLTSIGFLEVKDGVGFAQVLDIAAALRALIDWFHAVIVELMPALQHLDC
jgi:hypothetical protein